MFYFIRIILFIRLFGIMFMVRVKKIAGLGLGFRVRVMVRVRWILQM